MTIAEQLSRWSAALRYEDLPPEVIHEVKRRLIDSCATSLGAYGAEPCRIARALAGESRADTGATIWGTRHRTTADLAAFANGTMVRYLDFNDTYLSKEPAHPSDNIPACLAVAEAAGCHGRDLILAIVIAYETQCRLCDAASLRAHGWDHVSYGTFSTALAAARLLGLDVTQTVHALGIAGVGHNALRQTRAGTLSMWKACAFANAARNGMFAARLAQRGMTGPSDIFEGVFGFWKLVSGPFELPILGGAGGAPFKILDTYIKYYPVEYHAQSGVAAAIELRSKIPVIDDIAEINIQTFDACVDIIAGEPEKWAPRTRETADHSLPFCVAAALMDGAVTLDTFSAERLADPRLHSLVQKVKVHRNAELSAQYPDGIPNDITITLRSGETFNRRVRYPRGHPKNAMTDEEVEDKFRRLAEPLLSPAETGKILRRLWDLDEMELAEEVTGLLKGVESNDV